MELLKKEVPFIYRGINTLAQTVLAGLNPLQSTIAKLAGDQIVAHLSDFAVKTRLERYINPNPPKFFLEKVKKEAEEEN